MKWAYIINIRSILKSVLDILNTTIRPGLGNFTSKQYFKKNICSLIS